MRMENNNDFLGTEKIGKLLLKFSIPCILSLVITALYNIVDQVFVGNSSLGYLGNAATGIVFPILIIVQAFAWCFGDATAAFLAICQGRKDTKSSHKAVGTSIVISTIISIILMLIIYFCRVPILKLFGASKETLPLAESYLTILVFFFPALMIFNVVNPIIRSDGSPIWSMISMGAGAVANIILDPIFIFACNWGIEGAAWATVIGQVLSMVLNLAYFAKSKTFKIKLSSFIPDFKLLGKYLPLGISSFITQLSIVAISLACNIMLSKYGALSNYGADIPIAVISVETKIFTLLINIIVGLVLGGQPIFGYNIGAGKLDRVKKTYGLIFVCTLLIGLVFTAINEIYPDIFFMPFGSMDQTSYVEYARKTFRIFLSLVTFTCMIKMTSIFFQACGKPIQAMISSLLRDIVFFIPSVIIVPMIFESNSAGSGITGLLISAPIADVLAVIVALILVGKYFRTLGLYTKNKYQGVDFPEDYVVTYPNKKGPVITISREHGSNGKYIASLVAKKLDIPFFDKDVFNYLAKQKGLPTSKTVLTHNNMSVTNSLYLTKNYDLESINAQADLIKEVGNMGSSVIVGRGADYYLKDNPNVIRIFIYANEKTRIKNIINNYDDTVVEARKQIIKSDYSRSNYYKHITSGLKWRDKNNYDLFIDSSSGDENTADKIVSIINKN